MPKCRRIPRVCARLNFQARKAFYLKNLEKGKGLQNQIADAYMDMNRWVLNMMSQRNVKNRNLAVFVNNYSDAGMRSLG